ncbi:MAG: hypothetical protein ACLR6J_15210 [Parabacteroides merdae]
MNFDGKRIIRPAYKNVLEEQPYLPLLQTANTGWACELRDFPDYDNDPDSPFSMRQSGFAVFPSCRPSGCPLFAGRFW